MLGKAGDPVKCSICKKEDVRDSTGHIPKDWSVESETFKPDSNSLFSSGGYFWFACSEECRNVRPEW